MQKRHVRSKEEDMKNAKYQLIVLFVALFCCNAIAEEGWFFQGSLTDTPGWPAAYGQGLAVDVEGKIWYTPYYSSDSVEVDTSGDGVVDKWQGCRAIYVFYPNGQEVSWSPIKTMTYQWEGETVIDTLWESNRGLERDQNGDIVAASWSVLYRINHLNGECIAKLLPYPEYTTPEDPWYGPSLTKPAFDNNGNMFTCTVITGYPIKAFDSDWNYIDDVIQPEDHSAYSRVIEVSPDGNDIYYCGFTSGYGYYRFHSDAGLDGDYTTRIDTLIPGGSVEGVGWQPVTGYLWGGQTGNSGTLKAGCFYALDVTTDQLVDSIIVDTSITDLGVKPRGIDFSPDGKTAYITYFNSWDNEAVYIYTRDSIPPPPPPQGEWSVNVGVIAGTLSDNDNQAGVLYSASDDYDYDYDIPEPPPPASNYVQLTFPHPEWGAAFNDFKYDMKEPANLYYFQKVWDFTVATDQVNVQHDIKITPIQGIDFSAGIYIRNMATGEIVTLDSENNTYTFTPTEVKEYFFQLLVGRLYPVQEISKNVKAGWNLMGLPLSPITPTVSGIFGDLFASSSYLYQYSNSEGYYHVDYLKSGEGFWLGLMNDSNVEFIGDSLSDTVSVQLEDGNNMIANPFKYMISKANIDLVNSQGQKYNFENAVLNNWISGVLHYWNNESGGEYVTTDTLGIWQGAWLYTLEPGLTIYYIPGAATKGYASSVDKIGKGGWEVLLRLESEWANDISGAFGMDDNANDNFDAQFDFPEPPMAPTGKYLSGYFEHTDWNNLGPKFDRDIKASKEAATIWYYLVNSSANGSIKLSWSINNLPSGYELSLYDPVTDKTVDMTSQFEYDFNYSNQRIFEITFRPAVSIEEENQLPTVYKLSQNFPNPFNPVTKINYQLPKSGMVNLSVYNINGQLVETLVKEHQGTGYYSVQFDASIFSSGVYIYKIIAGEFTDIKKCIIVK